LLRRIKPSALNAGRRDLTQRFVALFTPWLSDAETVPMWAWIKSGCEKKRRPITFATAWIEAGDLRKVRELQRCLRIPDSVHFPLFGKYHVTLISISAAMEVEPCGRGESQPECYDRNEY
jgi:hypothetical protein